MALKFSAKLDDRSMRSIRKKITDLQAPIERPVAKRIGNKIVKAMKADIAKGKSPILGGGKGGRSRFPAYRGSYRKRIQKDGFIRVKKKRITKKLRPVNLKLTGNFLKNLQAISKKIKKGFGIEIGFSKGKEIAKEEGHREGARGQAIRPIIPIGNEKFNKNIQDIYLDLINAAIRKIIKRPK